jgi:serine/threonine-protein kinase
MGDRDPLVGKHIGGRYQIVELVKSGGMGTVYRAVQRLLDRTVAIKLIHPHQLESRGAVTRFLQEARLASRLNHPNVVSVFDFGRASPEEGGHVYLVMEYVTGADLGTVLRQGKLPLPRLASILRQTLAALGEAHALGITHRDVKPDNILLTPKRGGGDLVKVIDFGIARAGDRQLTQAGRTLGTPQYMAPEQFGLGTVGPASDIYAVGVILFEMLTGQVLFDGDVKRIAEQHRLAPRPDPRVLAAQHDVPLALAEVCVRALAVDPKDRYPDTEAFAEAIVRAVRSRGSKSDAWILSTRSSRPPPPPPSSGKPKR